jgi:hypothetical protein
MAINGVGMDEIFNRMMPLFPLETKAGFRMMHSAHFRNRDMLRYIGVVEDEDIVPITVRDVNGTVFTVYAPFVSSFVSSIGETMDDMEVTHHEVDTEKFFSLRLDEDFWFRYFPEDGMMYVRILRFPTTLEYLHEVSLMSVEEREYLPCVQFANELIDTITRQSGVDIFVIDFRGNSGGTQWEGVIRFFAWTQEEGSRELMGNVYIAIDDFTYSNGVVHSKLFRSFIDDAQIIGAPAAGGLNLFGGGPAFTLPNSQIDFWLGGDFIILDPYTETNTLYPDIFVYRTLEDYVNHHDAVIETIRQRAEGNAPY